MARVAWSGATPPMNAARAALPRRVVLLRRLRVLHGWLGLWGAVFGLLFGLSGIVLSHRSVLKLPVTKGEQSVVQLRFDAAPRSTGELAQRVAAQFGFEGRTPRVKVDAARPVAWNGVPLVQPERWELVFDHPARGAKVEYFVGSGSARIEKFDATAIGLLTRLHMSTGVNAAWVLLADAFAGALIALALSGTLLWTQLRVPRLAGAAVLVAAPALAAGWLALNL